MKGCALANVIGSSCSNQLVLTSMAAGQVWYVEASLHALLEHLSSVNSLRCLEFDFFVRHVFASVNAHDRAPQALAHVLLSN